MTASARTALAAGRARTPASTPAAGALDCGGEPCDAVARGLLRVLRPEAGRAGRQRTRVRRLPHGDRQLPALARQRRGEVPAAAAAAPVAIPTPTIRCSGRSTPTISASTARTRSDFSNLRQNGLVRITVPLPPNIRLIDPATNAPSSETFVDVWRSVPTVNDVALTGPDDGNRVAARPEPDRRLPAGRPRRRRSRSRRSARSSITRRSRARRRSSCSTICRRSSACCSRTIVCAPWPTPSREGTRPLPDPDPPLDRARRAGQGGVRARLRPVPRRPRTVDAAGHAHRPPAPVIRFHTILSQCPRPGRHRDAGAIRVCALPAAPRAQCADLRDRAVGADAEPGGLLPAGTKVRRTSSDPGRALLTGFVGGPPALGRLGQVRHSRAARHRARPRRTSTTTAPPRSRRWSTTTSSSSSACRRTRRRAAPSRRSRRPTACTSIGGRRRKNARRCIAYLRKL